MAVQRISLAASMGEREPGDTKDVLLKNCYKETIGEMDAPTKNANEKSSQDTVRVVKRPGLKSFDDLSAASSDVGRGIANWEGRIYTILGDEVFSDETDVGTIGTTTGRCTGFDIAIDAESPSENVLVFNDGTQIIALDDEGSFYTVGAAGSSQDIEVSAFIPGCVVLDQYVFAADADGNIYNSPVGDITDDWLNNGGVINMEVKLDGAVAIARYINYLVGFGEETTQFFYDAGNAAPSSPLDPFQGMTQLVGCAAGFSVANCERALLWIAKAPKGGRWIAMLEEGFKPERVSTPALDAILDKEGTNISNAYAFFIRHAGHRFYILTLPTTSGRTFVYDLDEKNWYEWSSDVSDTESYFTGIAATQEDGTVIVLDEDNGLLYDFDEETYRDTTGGGNETVKVEIRTKVHDGGTLQNKIQDRLQVISDLNSSSGTVNVAWSDDDYQSWSTNRTQDMDNYQSWLTRGGLFKRRAYRVQHEQNLPFRAEAIELDIDMGHYGRSG